MLLVNIRQKVMNIACTKDTDHVDQNERKKNRNTANHAVMTLIFSLKNNIIYDSLFIVKKYTAKI